MKKILVAVLLMLVPVALTACNTVAGAGEDVTAGSRAVQRAID